MDATNNTFQNIVNRISKFVETFGKLSEIVQTIPDDTIQRIGEYLLTFADFAEWIVATDNLDKHQIVFTDDLTNDFAVKINKSQDIPNTVLQYYKDNESEHLNALIKRCIDNLKSSKYEDLFNQIVFSAEKGHYRLACVGIFSVLDGILSDKTNMQTTGFKKRFDYIQEKMDNNVQLNDLDRKYFCIYKSIREFNDSIFADSDFHRSEPNMLNRHWLLHGRTSKEYTEIDFLITLLWIDAIFYLSDLCNDDII